MRESSEVSFEDSMGINALAPNARAYGASSIGCFRVVRYA